MGKHTSARRTGRVTALAVAAVIAVLGGGTWAVASLTGDDDAGTSPTSSASRTSPPAASSASSTPSATAEPAPSASATVDQAAAQSEERHAKCVSEVASATRMADAVAASATHWQQHVAAQLAWDARTQSFAATQAQWAESKKFGSADEREFAAASTAMKAATGACADAAKTAPPVPATAACASRLAALQSAGTTGTVIHRQWAAHLQMMRHKQHADMGAYHQRWLTMVADAHAPLRTYTASAAAVTRAPACA